MKSTLKVIILVIILASVYSSFAAPLENKHSTGCISSKGAIRSSVDVGAKDENVHLLADLDALSTGTKRSGIESDCEDSAEKKSKTLLVDGKSAVSELADKKQVVHVIEENPSVVNEDEVSKTPIVETGKAAIRSGITTNSSSIQNANGTAAESQNSTNSTTFKESIGASVNKSKENDAVPQGSAAKTFIASNLIEVNAIKRSGSFSRKVKQYGTKTVKVKNAAKKSNQIKSAHKTSSDDGPSMQTGALSKEADTEEKATTKSTSSLLNPLNTAIKSLDSATKLLGMAATSNKHATLSNKDSTLSSKDSTASNTATEASKTTDSTPEATKVTSEQTAGLKPSSASNTTSQDVTSSTRSSGSSSADAKQSSTATTTAKAAKAPDPYAEIAVGPDSPKMPDLKTGSEKTGLPVMKIDPSGSPPEQVSFDKADEPTSPKLSPLASSSRAGPQDVGGILDQLTDRLNKGGVAPENPLPPTESKAITDQLSDYDHDALDQAKGWEATGLKAIEKLKSAEFSHGNMKTELTKELTDRLAGGYENSLEGGLEGGGSEVGSLESPAQSNYPQQTEYSRQHSSQWPEFNSVESLDTEAQREEQPFSQYSEGRGGSYEGASDAMMSPEQNAYDRQEIPSYLNSEMGRESADSTPGQEFYKRSIILKPYYSNTVPYAFKFPYDD